MKIKFIITAAFLLLTACNFSSQDKTKVQTGLDRLSEYHDLFKNKRVGIITNHTGYNAKGEYITDVFRSLKDVQIAALFGPEHGIGGSAAAGDTVTSDTSAARKIPIYSLYGAIRKPTPEMLKDVDILVFDIQGVGARFYTYIYTMSLAMEAAAEQGKQFVVLDRPDPITGIAVEGNLLEPQYATFVGLYPIPVRYGMTIGELARMINGQGWLENGVKADLTVIPMKNWQRKMWYDQTGLKFIKPSPNMPDLETATLYPGMCLIEGTNVSEGRGTTMPFKIIGAPWIDGKELADNLNSLHLPGVSFRDTSFTPVSIPGVATNPKQEGRLCSGIRIVLTNRDQLKSYPTGIRVINAIHNLYPDSLQFRVRHMDRLCGTSAVREAILHHADMDSLINSWQDQLNKFKEKEKEYEIYP